jgi:gamma-glutamyltranspeptidase/glutathione hydrolase
MILFREDTPILILGSPGGTRIFPSLTQILLNVTRFSMSLDEAIEAPRFFSYTVQGQARDISVEDRIPEAVRRTLESWGHGVTVRGSYDTYFGGAQGILLRRDAEPAIVGAADSRRDGYGAGH